MVATAWLSVHITGRLSAAGEVLLLSTTALFLSANFVGRVVDRFKKKRRLFFWSQIGIVLTGALPAFAGIFAKTDAAFSVLALSAVSGALSAILAVSAIDYFVKSLVIGGDRAKLLASLSIVSQIALIAGAGAAGLIVSRVGMGTAFSPIMICGVLSAIFSCFFLPDLIAVPGIPPHPTIKHRRPFSNLRLYADYPFLLPISCCSVLVFAIGQITNTLLPGLITFKLLRGSADYALFEMVWSAGAFCVSFIFLGLVKKSLGQTSHDLIVIILMALAIGLIPFLRSYISLLTVHLFLGAGFALVRIRSEIRFLIICPTPFLGRFRANTLMMTSLLGGIIFSVPLFIPALSVASMYLSAAGTLLILAIVILIWSKMRHSVTPLDSAENKNETAGSAL